MEDDVGYFRRRAVQEREHGMKAAHPAARQSHLDLSARYEELASAIVAHAELTLGRGDGDDPIAA